jgi:hypothetical protein
MSLNIDYAKLRRQVDAHPYPLVFATISGAHLYGFPSPDSDFDLRGLHLLPLEQVVCMAPGEVPARSATSPFTARPPARLTSSACRCGSTGRRSIAVGRWSSTVTRPCRTPSGSTKRSTSTPAASLAEPSRHYVIQNLKRSRFPLVKPTACRHGHSCRMQMAGLHSLRSIKTTTCWTWPTSRASGSSQRGCGTM